MYADSKDNLYHEFGTQMVTFNCIINIGLGKVSIMVTFQS